MEDMVSIQIRTDVLEAVREIGKQCTIKQVDTHLHCKHGVIAIQQALNQLEKMGLLESKGLTPCRYSIKPLPKKQGYERYQGIELRPYTGRPDANDHMRHGSMVSGVNVGYKPAGCRV